MAQLAPAISRPGTLRSVAAAVGRPLWVDAVTLRVAGLFMLVAAVVLPYVPGWPGLACPLRTMTGIPCPFCGMTTSVKATMRLQLREAFAANPAGIVAVITALVLIVLRPARFRVPLGVLLGGALLMWVFELNRFSII